MPKQKSTSSSRSTDKSTPDSVANGRTNQVDHNETTGLLHPGTSQSTSELQIGLRSSTTAARHGPSPGRTSSPVRKPSIASTSSTTWKLKYQDFLPRTLESFSADSWKTNESFQSLVSRANDWLRANPDVTVRTCQTVTWSSHDLTTLTTPCGGSGELMVLSRAFSDNAATFYLRGLRLWLVPSPVGATQSILRCVDFTPDKKTTNNFQRLLSVANTKIDLQQIKGRVITLETVTVPLLGSTGKPDSGLTRWTENVDDDVMSAFFLRLFYVTDSNTSITGRPIGELGFRDVVPQPLDNGCYEGFEDLVDRANVWLKEHKKDNIITNMQSVMVLKEDEESGQSTLGSSCFFTLPGANSDRPVDFFRILRVAFVSASPKHSSLTANESTPRHRRGSSSSTSGSAAASAAFSAFTYETFTPELVARYAATLDVVERADVIDRVETMNETFAKVIAFLQNSGTVEVLCAEVVFNPMQLYINSSEMDDPSMPDAIHFLYTIRVYLAGQAKLHDGSVKSVRRASNLSINRASGTTAGGTATVAGGRKVSATQGDTSDDQIHPGPIFLSHVVSRKFPYRWLVLGISAFTCMAIIVAVSVVYSNR